MGKMLGAIPLRLGDKGKVVYSWTLHELMSEQRQQQPERRLLWAMLKRWLLDYSGVCIRNLNAETSLEARFSAVEWAWSKEHGPFSYLWVCDVLDLDAEWVRSNADKIASRVEWQGPLLGRIGSLEI